MDQMISLSRGFHASATLNITDRSQIFFCPGQPLLRAEPREYKAYDLNCKLVKELKRVVVAVLSQSHKP